jgi:hypothetical protein
MADTPELSPELAEVLASFRHFAVSDDADRAGVVERTDRDTLMALVKAVEPLYPEINVVLDRLVAKPHPVSPDEERLEVELDRLAQAAMEAELELARNPT